jgi:hypothetical protein
MGFGAEQSRRALAAKRGNAQKAVDLLLSGRPIPDAKPQRRSGSGDEDTLPSGMPRAWAHRLATEPEYFEQLVRRLILCSPEQHAAVLCDDPAKVLRDAGLDPARFDVDGVKRRVAHLRGMAGVGPLFDGPVEKIRRLRHEFPAFGIDILVEILQNLRGDETAAREQLRQMMGP